MSARLSRPGFRERGYDKLYDRNRRAILHSETICWICGEPVDKSLKGSQGPSVDHVVPRERGGTNARSNLRLAHLGCNSARRDGERAKRERPPQSHPGLI